MPKPDEWIHEFSWHGTDPNNKTAKVKDLFLLGILFIGYFCSSSFFSIGQVKDMLKFKLLRIIADQFYYNVREVRIDKAPRLSIRSCRVTLYLVMTCLVFVLTIQVERRQCC